MGRAVAAQLSPRFVRTILELGGNNAAMVAPWADFAWTERAILFSAVGTAGQRCTSLRRLFVHRSLFDGFLGRLKSLYARVKVGNPLDSDTLVGPLIDSHAYAGMRAALDRANVDPRWIAGGERADTPYPGGD